uniref:Uncharacterized protein n=1 Tax=Rhizophora mucronata TaxID=61149 RepID=A0A2P2QHG4_RHIMU
MMVMFQTMTHLPCSFLPCDID